MSLFVYGMCAKGVYWHFGVDKDPPSRVKEHNIKYARGDLRRVTKHSPHWKLVFVLGPFRNGCTRLATTLQKMRDSNKPADPVLLARYTQWYLQEFENQQAPPLFTDREAGYLRDPLMHEVYCRLVFYYMSKSRPTPQRSRCS